MKTSSQLLTARQAAEFLGISRATLWRMCREGILPYIRFNSRVFRFREADLETWLAARSR